MPDERILVVEADTAALFNAMSLALRRRGYQVEQAEDGCSALDILGAQPPFSVLLTASICPAYLAWTCCAQYARSTSSCRLWSLPQPTTWSRRSLCCRDGAYDFLTNRLRR
jgi:DNA-binding response OmpR family regulator